LHLIGKDIKIMIQEAPLMKMAKVVALVLVALMALPAFMSPHASAGMYPTLRMRNFGGGDTQSVLSFAQGGKQQTGIQMDINSYVFNASVDVMPGPYTTGGLDYPLSPTLDIGADGTTEWGYSGLGYGRWGLQDVFNDNSSSIKLQFDNPNDTYDIRFKMPKDATILGGSFTTGGWPVPYWGPEYVVSNPKTKSPVENNPVLLPFNGLLFEAWVSADPTLKSGDDQDIVYKFYDGTNWTKTMEITLAGDFMEDDSPQLVIFQDRLYCVWSAAESTDFFANDDVLLRSTADGYNWSAITKISPPVRNGMNDWPLPIVFQDKLYIIWKTTDPNISDHTSDNDMDLVLRWYDGVSLGPIEEITKNDDGAMDWSFSSAVYNNRLYIVWETDISGFMGDQVDIVVKSFDGVSWSNRKTLSPDGDSVKDEIPGAYVWFNPVKKQDELWVIWGRGDGNQFGTGDINIVVRSFDGTTWTPMEEISQPGVVVQNMGQVLIGYEGRLYAIWIDGTESIIIDQTNTLVVFKIYGNIDIRSYDGYEWGNIKELTPEGTTNKATDPYLAVYNGKLYATWSFPNDATASSKDWDIILRNIDLKDVTLDIDVGNKGQSDWSGELTSSQMVIPLNASAIRAGMTGGTITDQYGNRITEVSMRIKSHYPAKIEAHDLMIEYEYPQHFDFKDRLNALLASKRPPVNDSRQAPDQTAEYKFEAGTSSSGDIIFYNLTIDYLINHEPFLVKDIPTIYMNEDTDKYGALDLEEYFSDDWDDGRLTFKVLTNEDPTGVGVQLNGTVLDLTTPTENWNGETNVSVAAYDLLGLRSPRAKIHIVVLPVNDPPILDFIPDATVKVAEKYSHKCTAHDVDVGEKLTFHSNISIVRIDPATGELHFTPIKRGVYHFNVSVDDGYGLWASQNVTYTVIGETTTAGTSTCFSMIAIVILAICIFLVAWKFKSEIAWHPVGPERLKVGAGGKGKKGPAKQEVVPGTEQGPAMPDDSVVDVPVIDMEDVPEDAAKTKAAPAKALPQRNLERYDANKDGFLDDREWSKAVEEIQKRKAERLGDLKAKARGLAKKEVTPGAQEGPEGDDESPPLA